MEKTKIVNIGGINGSKEGIIDDQSSDFQSLQASIKSSAASQDEAQKIGNAFLSIRFQMETYLREGSDKIVLAGEFIEQFLAAIKVKNSLYAYFTTE